MGINAYHGDASACLIDDGKIVAAVAEERFSRNKHEGGFPERAMEWCLKQTKKRVRHVAVSRNPALFRSRKIGAIIKRPRMLKSLKERLENAGQIALMASRVRDIVGKGAVLHKIEHHRAHLSYALATSNFDRCGLLSVDGFGDFVSTAWGSFDGKNFRIDERVFFPHSIGILYTAISQFLGFDGYGEEYKVMALASYGTARYSDLFGKIITNYPSGFRLNQKYFTHGYGGAKMSYGAGTPFVGKLYSNKMEELFGPARKRNQPLTERHYDLAATLQQVTNMVILNLAALTKKQSKSVNLAVSGGVMQNSVANGFLERSGIFENYWFPSAPGDDGTAIGAAAGVALAGGDSFLGRGNDSPFLGPGSDSVQTSTILNHISELVELLSQGKIIGWFEGKAEFGPRALGHRSILADPRSVEIKNKINAVVKKRESFRPFAPIVLREDAAKYFDTAKESPNMMTVVNVKPEWRNRLGAITHVDGTARVQTVDRKILPNFALLLEKWRERSGVGVLLNTSFNENEPIVNTRDEAVSCYRRTDMDALMVDGELFVK